MEYSISANLSTLARTAVKQKITHTFSASTKQLDIFYGCFLFLPLRVFSWGFRSVIALATKGQICNNKEENSCICPCSLHRQVYVILVWWFKFWLLVCFASVSHMCSIFRYQIHIFYIIIGTFTPDIGYSGINHDVIHSNKLNSTVFLTQDFPIRHALRSLLAGTPRLYLGGPLVEK